MPRPVDLPDSPAEVPEKAPVTGPTSYLGQVEPQGALLEDPATVPVRLAPVTTRPLGEADADTVGLGEATFDGENEYMPELTFDGALQQRNPMDDLTMDSLEKFGVKQNEDGSFASGNESATGWRGQVIAAARKMLGTPYVWGGTSYSGVDCSGLIQLLYGNVGRDMPRISADQARQGKRVKLSELQPGDLVAWDNSSRNNGADHIAIYIGDGKIIEAPRPGGAVQVNNIYDTGNAWGVSLEG